MEVNEEDTRRFNSTVTFILSNSFVQDLMDPFHLINNFSNNVEQEILEFTMRQSLQNDEQLREDDEKEIDEEIQIYNKTEDNKDEECSICMEKFEDKSRVFVCSCKQIFHYNCINKWVKSKGDCPICRKPIKTRIKMDDSFIDWIDAELDI